MALGLISSEQIQSFWVKNTRRRIFYAYPNGTAPLTGLLSLMENKETPLPDFGWNEERWVMLKTQTSMNSPPLPTPNVVFYIAGGTVVEPNPFNWWSGTVVGHTPQTLVRIYVLSGSNFQIDDTIVLYAANITATGNITTQDLSGRVTATGQDAANGNQWYIEVAATNDAFNTVLNGAVAFGTANSQQGLWLYDTGSAFAEGARSRSGRQNFPTEVRNYTQIQKTAFELTRTALKEPLTYDKSGSYKDVAKSNGINHLAQIEFTAFWGTRSHQTTTDPDTGQTVRRGFTGGIRWFLDQWEYGSVAAGGAFDYGQPDVHTLSDYIGNPNKRVIKLAGATISRTNFNQLISNVFTRTNSTDWSKLALCGPGYLAKVADVFERQIQWTSLRDSGFDGFDFQLVWHRSNSGDVYYKQHPLFIDPIMTNSCFYIDLGYMGYRPLSDSDTDIQPMIQLPDADKRKDQWLTEYGFEMPFPEAFMYVENLGGITLT